MQTMTFGNGSTIERFAAAGQEDVWQDPASRQAPRRMPIGIRGQGISDIDRHYCYPMLVNLTPFGEDGQDWTAIADDVEDALIANIDRKKRPPVIEIEHDLTFTGTLVAEDRDESRNTTIPAPEEDACPCNECAAMSAPDDMQADSPTNLGEMAEAIYGMLVALVLLDLLYSLEDEMIGDQICFCGMCESRQAETFVVFDLNTKEVFDSGRYDDLADEHDLEFRDDQVAVVDDTAQLEEKLDRDEEYDELGEAGPKSEGMGRGAKRAKQRERPKAKHAPIKTARAA